MQLVRTRHIARERFQKLSTIRMLTTYKIQGKVLRIFSSFFIKINNVGQEFQALFMSTTEPVDETGNTTNPTKSLCDPFIFDTVLTRAKSLVVVVGCPVALLGIEKHMVKTYKEKGKCWSTYLKTCLENKTFIIPDVFMLSPVDKSCYMRELWESISSGCQRIPIRSSTKVK